MHRHSSLSAQSLRNGKLSTRQVGYQCDERDTWTWEYENSKTQNRMQTRLRNVPPEASAELAVKEYDARRIKVALTRLSAQRLVSDLLRLVLLPGLSHSSSAY